MSGALARCRDQAYEGFHPIASFRAGSPEQWILLNDGMGAHIGRECVRRVVQLGRASPVVTVLGISFKETCRTSATANSST